MSSPEIRRCRPALGTLVEIRARGANPARLHGGVEQAFAAVARAQALWSFHDSASELSRLNREASRRAVTVDAWTFDLFALALRIHRASDGLFDPAIAPVLERSGLLPGLPGAARAGGATLADLELGSRRRVRFAQPMHLDLGGIAKGYAIDRAVEALQAAGVAGGMVNAGGDLRVFGSDSWPLEVRDPTDPARTLLLGQIENVAVATSAVYFSRGRDATGRWHSAIISPQNGRPWLARASVTVKARDAATADALTKVLALAGRRRGTTLLQTLGGSGVWLAANGRSYIMEAQPCAA